MTTRICDHCREKKDIEEFNWKFKTLGVRHDTCRECMKWFVKRYFKGNGREKHLENVKERKNAARIVAREYVWEYLTSHPCVQCGESDPMVLEFLSVIRFALREDPMNRHLITLDDLTAEDIAALFEVAADLKAKRRQGILHPVLSGKTLAMIFEKPSLRTRVTFEAGMTQLGGHAIYLTPADIKLGERETVQDAARNLERWVDGIGARTFSHQMVERLARYSRIPVINGLTDSHHPVQILCDLFTLWEKRGRVRGLRVAFVGDGNNVCHSWLEGAAKVGLHFTLACPKGYEPDPVIFSFISFIIQIGVGGLLALLAVRKINKPLDKIIIKSNLFLYTLPSFVVGVFLILIFSEIFNILPSSGIRSFDFDSFSPFGKAIDYILHMIMPVITLSLGGIAVFFRYLRDGLEEAENKPFVLNLRANGFDEKAITLKHIIPNAMGPLIAVAGVELGMLLGGALITEVIFGLPGMGRLAVSAILQRDYPLIIGCTLTAGVLVIISNLTADVVKAKIDKRSLKDILN